MPQYCSVMYYSSTDQPRMCDHKCLTHLGSICTNTVLLFACGCREYQTGGGFYTSTNVSLFAGCSGFVMQLIITEKATCGSWHNQLIWQNSPHLMPKVDESIKKVKYCLTQGKHTLSSIIHTGRWIQGKYFHSPVFTTLADLCCQITNSRQWLLESVTGTPR